MNASSIIVHKLIMAPMIRRGMIQAAYIPDGRRVIYRAATVIGGDRP
jgi:hypothetical protein